MRFWDANLEFALSAVIQGPRRRPTRESEVTASEVGQVERRASPPSAPDSGVKIAG